MATQLADTSDRNLPRFDAKDGSRVPYGVFTLPEIYEREQEKIFRGPTWNFLGLAVEVPNSGDFKSTYIGDAPVVMTRLEDGSIVSWVNRCAHRGAKVCRLRKGNATSHSCVYHQWSYNSAGELEGVPFRKGKKGMPGMPADFEMSDFNLQSLRTQQYAGLVFATFSDETPDLETYLGPEMKQYIDRIFYKPIEYLGCTRQYAKSNWKLYFENVKDPYHASLLHLFHTTFNIFRVGMDARVVVGGETGLHSLLMSIVEEEGPDDASDYSSQNISTYNQGFALEDRSVLAMIREYDELASNHIQTIFPQLVIQQIHNTLVARQVLPKGPDKFELVFHFFGYEDDSEELRALRIQQANLVGPAGYISMEDTEATELVQRGVTHSPQKTSVIEMAKGADEHGRNLMSEEVIRKFWQGYAKLMELEA